MERPLKTYLIGVDTGGTYTDAAIVEPDTHRVVASAKALTTRGDLALGVTEAMEKALSHLPAGLAPEAIALVALSTTLATNAVVEGHGSPVAVLLVGFDPSMVERSGIDRAFPGTPLVLIGGGHDHNGEEKAPLDVEALERALAEYGNNVEAFAVASQFAIRNPGHEHRVRDIIITRTGRPVTVSSELSSALDAPRRALTAVLNARLISRIATLIDAVKSAMKRFALDCPLMIVKGDGTLALSEAVARRPLETILSGPAASLVGAKWLSGLPSLLMSDMGGTTTDIAILEAGRPRISEAGAEVGGWRTMVRAIDVKTIGLGGDSEVTVAPNGSIAIGPQRIVPVSLIGWRFPEILALLDSELANPEINSLTGRFILRPLGAKDGDPVGADLSQREREILKAVTARPKPLAKVALSAGAQRAVTSLRRRGLVQLAGYTPSDAAHALGLQTNWSKDAAVKAAKLVTRLRWMRAPTEESVEALVKEIWSEVVRLSGRAILDSTIGSGGETSERHSELLDAVCRGEGRLGLANVAISPSIPVVAVGAPVKVYYGEVARRLQAQVVFPDCFDVANAVGAATGVIARTVVVHVAGDGSGVFRVHAPRGTQIFTSPGEALDQAAAAAREAARSQALAMGAGEIEIRIEVEKHMLPGTLDDRGLFSARVVAEALGRPQFLTRKAGDSPADTAAASIPTSKAEQ